MGEKYMWSNNDWRSQRFMVLLVLLLQSSGTSGHLLYCVSKTETDFSSLVPPHHSVRVLLVSLQVCVCIYVVAHFGPHLTTIVQSTDTCSTVVYHHELLCSCCNVLLLCCSCIWPLSTSSVGEYVHNTLAVGSNVCWSCNQCVCLLSNDDQSWLVLWWKNWNNLCVCILVFFDVFQLSVAFCSFLLWCLSIEKDAE